jgi:hypothetical protein
MASTFTTRAIDRIGRAVDCILLPRAQNPQVQYCSLNPSDPICVNVPSFYNYRLSLPANAVFLALFSVSFVGFVAVLAATRGRGLGFTIAMLLGLLCEIIGYAGRVMSYSNQWAEKGFLMQICCLTIGPAFLAAGVYLCLRRIVYIFGPENARFRPEWYTRIVSCPCNRSTQSGH